MKKKSLAITRRTAVDKKNSTIRDAVRHKFYEAIAETLRTARTKTYRVVNFTMVEAYWNVGRMIIEEEQKSKKRAEYGTFLIKNLAVRLTMEFGNGFTKRNLWNFRQFFLFFPIVNAVRSQSPEIHKTETLPDNPNLIRNALRSKSPETHKTYLMQDNSNSIRYALRTELTWTHYRLLIRVENPKAREWYMNEAADQNWSTRALERQINSLYYERLHLSRDKTPVIDEMRDKTAPLVPRPEDFIKDPYVLEFLGLPDSHKFRESELEQAIIEKLQVFMLELGRGFAFVARQKRISTETKDFFVDLVFYNYILKCFVLIDLKTGELTHQDIGQMDMYVRLYEDKMKGEGDNPTIGIILCTEKDATVVKYSVLKGNKSLFASKYKLYLPTEQELIEEIRREKHLILRERGERYG
jgi:predicted nuclease of restriction endonuclease-like (RecB) superfamily